jgi:peptide/nickel transport system substrate-binding protein
MKIMSFLTEDAPACFMWRHKLLWGMNNRIDYKPPPDSLIFGMDIKVVKK